MVLNVALLVLHQVYAGQPGLLLLQALQHVIQCLHEVLMVFGGWRVVQSFGQHVLYLLFHFFLYLFHLDCLLPPRASRFLLCALVLQAVLQPILQFPHRSVLIGHLIIFLHFGPKQRVVPVLHHVLRANVPHRFGDHCPLLALLQHQVDEGEIFVDGPLGFELEGVQMVHPSLPALLGSAEVLAVGLDEQSLSHLAPLVGADGCQ